jgi:putative ABC transport system permease protein
MFKNNIKTAFRSLLKNKVFTFLNVAGLALGITTCLIIVLYVVDEFSFDKYNLKSDRIFRVNTDIKYGDNATSRAIAAPAIAQALVSQFPEVEKAVRLLPDGALIKKGNEFIREDKVVYCDSSIFDVFTLPMIEGDPKTALSEPNSVVITESAALKYFTRTNVVGQNLIFFHDSVIHKITAVIHDVPKQSHFQFDILVSMQPVEASKEIAFNAIYPFSTYILLRPGSNYKNLEAKFPALLKEHLGFLADMEKGGDYIKINLTPLKDIHLKSNRTNELGKNGNIQYLNIFSIIAVFILLIACINFINLSTARSANRAREVGVRKVLGSSRKNLTILFLCESFIITIAATVLAVFSTWLLLPLFNQLSEKNLSLYKEGIPCLISSLLAVVIVVGLFAGAYPAFFLSSFQPVQVLKGKLSSGFKRSKTRNLLVVFQFALSIFMIIGTIVIYNQLHFIQNKDLGFKRSQSFVIKHINELDGDLPAIFQQEIKKSPSVKDASLSSFLPTGGRRWINFLTIKETGIQVQLWPVDANYVNVMGMKIAKGRNFSNKLATDSAGIIINETAAKMLGIEKDPLNQAVSLGKINYNVIAVVKDFNFSSLRDNINPLAMVLMTSVMKKYEGDGADNLIVSVNTANIPLLLSQVETKWKALSNNKQFDYSFMDEDFDSIYRSEQRMGKLFIIFTSLTIIIACLGLFGLAAYGAEQRTKEISIRKVLGANVSTIVALLSKDFIKQVIVSIFIAIPFGWLAMQTWLRGFAYRINIQWWVLCIASLAAIIIALITISFQSIKAANSNPVKYLRSE